MVYYLFTPNGQLKNPYWYKYLEIYKRYNDYIKSYTPDYLFRSRLFTVYICQSHDVYEMVDYNVCILEEGITLYYYDDVVFIETSKRCDNIVLGILNKYQR